MKFAGQEIIFSSQETGFSVGKSTSIFKK